MDRAERHDSLTRFILLHSSFLFPLFLEGKRKRENNNQSQKSCPSARSKFTDAKNATFVQHFFAFSFLQKTRMDRIIRVQKSFCSLMG